MSAESEFTRDKDGFLKCQDCPRRFLTETGFENHSTNQHEKEIKPDQNQQYGPSFPKNTQSKEECSPDNLLFRSQVDLKLHITKIKQIQMMDQHRLTKTETQILKYKLYMSHKKKTINLFRT